MRKPMAAITSKQRRSRLFRFYSSVIVILLLIAAVSALLWFLYTRFNLFDQEIGGLIYLFQTIEAGVQTKLIAGISIGSMLIALSFLLIPAFSRKINRQAFFTSIWRGILSAFTYLVASKLYEIALKKGHLAVFITNIIFIFITFILIETIIILISDTDERGLRTELTASISSGILFGILVQLLVSIGSLLKP
mgnify:FL=1